MEFHELYRKNPDRDPADLMNALREGRIDRDNESAVFNRSARNIERFHATGDRAVLDETVVMIRNALATLPSSSARGPDFQTNLSVCLEMTYAITGELGTLGEAAAAAQVAVNESGPGHPGYPLHADQLCRVLTLLAERTENAMAAEQATVAGAHAVAYTSREDPDWAARSAHYGTAQFHRYGYSGEIEDLTSAAVALEDARDRSVAGDPIRHEALLNLGVVRAELYDATADPLDLDEAITSVRAGLAALGREDPQRSGFVGIMGGLLRSRFELTGDRSDLDEAVRLGRESVVGEADDPPRSAGHDER